MKKITVILLIFILAAGIAGCGSGKKSLNRYQATYLDLFDTVTTITGYEANEKLFKKNAQLIYDELETYHKLFDIYNSYEGINNLKTINENAGIQPVKADQRLIDMLKFALEMNDYSGGMYNIAMGSVLTLWHEAREYGIANPDKAYLPDKTALKEAAEHMNAEDVIIDEKNGTVYLKDKRMSLDAGGIGKGWAAERVTSLLRERRIRHYLIAVGGNIETSGAKSDGSDWVVGVENPCSTGDNDAYKHIVSLTDKAVVTSGSYERYYTVDGERYHHIIDPVSLYPKNTYILITVISDSSAMADILTTALFNMERQEGLELIEKTEGTEAYWLYSDGTELFSSGFNTYIDE
jgi:thiamine biosynthesis lipoprotein